MDKFRINRTFFVKTDQEGCHLAASDINAAQGITSVSTVVEQTGEEQRQKAPDKKVVIKHTSEEDQSIEENDSQSVDVDENNPTEEVADTESDRDDAENDAIEVKAAAEVKQTKTVTS